MININLIFIFIAGVAFLGFVINALFDRLHITKMLPLMIIGLLVGPVLGVINSGPNSTIANLAPLITAIAISFILFDVGLNINIAHLRRIILRGTAFTMLLVIVTGMSLAAIAHFTLGWSWLEALILGFALGGPSSVVVPTIMRVADVGDDIKTTLIYESVVSDSLQLAVPILLLGILANMSVSLRGATELLAQVIFGSIAMGAVFAIVWLYILKRFEKYSKMYGWMLTISMVIATYGIAQELNYSGAITVFVFSIIFSNFGTLRLRKKKDSKEETDSIRKGFNAMVRAFFHFSNMEYIKDYQREIEFFTSTFFFVYIGMLFNVHDVSTLLFGMAIGAVVAMIVIRRIFSFVLSKYMKGTPQERGSVKTLIAFDIPRGLSPAIVATLPEALGINIPGFLNLIFIVILFTNIVASLGVFFATRKGKTAPVKATQPEQRATAAQAVAGE
jgi:NhaP-type Na+/H+ or K+/H+ antiporter